MREKKEQMGLASRAGSTQHSTPDLVRLMGGVSKRAGKIKKGAPDSVIAIYKNRLTYTFIMENEVASIHYDRSRGEIFFRGHNIAHMELGSRERKALIALIGVLEEDEQGREFKDSYSATLDRVLADK
jgi:hypothetical protein